MFVVTAVYRTGENDARLSSGCDIVLTKMMVLLGSEDFRTEVQNQDQF
jgi:hypothetical protein